MAAGLSDSTAGATRVRGHVLGELFGILVASVLLSFCLGVAQTQNRWSTAVYCAVVAMASAAVGGLFGLLFGIPRALTSGAPSPSPAPPASDPTSPTTSPSGGAVTSTVQPQSGGYSANTNLE